MSNTNTGGPAFPIVAEHESHVLEIGMTLRDYFAAKAMQSELIVLVNMPSKEVARRAYEWADAMLKAREQ